MTTKQLALTAIDIALDPDRDTFGALSLDLDALGEPRISLVRCLALTEHLESVFGAVERAVPAKSLRGLVISVTGREIVVNGKRSIALLVEPTLKLSRIRARIMKAIKPGIITFDASPSVGDFMSSHIGPLLLADLSSRRLPPLTFGVQSVSIYEVAGAEHRLTRRLHKLASAVEKRS
jgi:hypothetical protein